MWFFYSTSNNSIFFRNNGLHTCRSFLDTWRRGCLVFVALSSSCTWLRWCWCSRWSAECSSRDTALELEGLDRRRERRDREQREFRNPLVDSSSRSCRTFCWLVLNGFVSELGKILMLTCWTQDFDWGFFGLSESLKFTGMKFLEKLNQGVKKYVKLTSWK